MLTARDASFSIAPKTNRLKMERIVVSEIVIVPISRFSAVEAREELNARQTS